ncbi:MAG: citrate synthase family protein [Trueperaceae bacterium]
MRNDGVGADEAAEILGVSKATLYSYVSRGMLTSRLKAPGSRARIYDKSELMALKHRNSFRKDPETAAAEVIEFGIPILTTAISQITETEHSYRGISSGELAREYTFEQVAEFLWTGRWQGASLPEPNSAWAESLDLSLLEGVDRSLSPIEQMQSILPKLQHQNLGAYRTTPDALLGSAIELIRYLVYLSTACERPGRISECMAQAWGVDPQALETLLIVVADHELNIATFTARCAASAGSTLYQSVLAGLAALQGYRHLFGQVSEAKAFMEEVIATGDAKSVVRSYLRRRGAIPGVQNPYRRLYSGPDPRVLTLTENLEGTEHYSLLLEALELIDQATQEPPRIDFALAVSEPLLGLPHDSIHSIIAIGRTAGMIAHVFEQYSSERVIRPRARYVGEARVKR